MWSLSEESGDLEHDLQAVVKKVHLRVILKSHAKLKALKLAEPADQAAVGLCSTSVKAVESSVLQLIPCAKDVMTFQHLDL